VVDRDSGLCDARHQAISSAAPPRLSRRVVSLREQAATALSHGPDSNGRGELRALPFRRHCHAHCLSLAFRVPERRREPQALRAAGPVAIPLHPSLSEVSGGHRGERTAARAVYRGSWRALRAAPLPSWRGARNSWRRVPETEGRSTEPSRLRAASLLLWTLERRAGPPVRPGPAREGSSAPPFKQDRPVRGGRGPALRMRHLPRAAPRVWSGLKGRRGTRYVARQEGDLLARRRPPGSRSRTGDR
jgi:hypothetical protein